jgi:hypothetical protein
MKKQNLHLSVSKSLFLKGLKNYKNVHGQISFKNIRRFKFAKKTFIPCHVKV